VIAKEGIDPFEYVRPVLEDAEVNLINLECVLSDSSVLRRPFSDILISPERNVRLLEKNGINLVNTANNHALDHGRQAFERSIRLLRESGIEVIGYDERSFFQEEAAVIESDGRRTGFLGYNISNFSESGRRKTLDRIRGVISEASVEVDLLVLSMHWGEEYTNIPPPYVIRYGRELLEAGADVIHGHHSHQVQGAIESEGRVFAPSLGNFVFDQKVPENRITAVLRIETGEDAKARFRWLPCYMNEMYQPEPAPDLIGYFEKLNGYLRDSFAEGSTERFAGTVESNVRKGHRANRVRMRLCMIAHFWHYLPHIARLLAFRRSRDDTYSIIRDEESLEGPHED